MKKSMNISLCIASLLSINFACQQNEALQPINTLSENLPSSPQVSVTSNRYIDMENASLSSSNVLTDDGYSFQFITKGTYNTPYLSSSNKYRGTYGIAYSMPPTTASGSVTNDKSQHRIFSGSETNSHKFGEKKYYGMAIKIDASMPQPTSSVQFFQIWQGTPMSPPLELRLMPGGSGNTFNYELRIRNNNTTANPSAGTVVYSGTMTSGSWARLTLMAILRNTGDSQNGEIKLWQNGVEKVQWVGSCGYEDGIIYAGTGHTPNANFDSFFGPYRLCQNVSLKLYFDEVRYAGSYTEANPDGQSNY